MFGDYDNSIQKDQVVCSYWEPLSKNRFKFGTEPGEGQDPRCGYQ